MRTTLLTAVILTVPTGFVNAHNLFVSVQRQDGGPDLINVVFEHSPWPGTGEHNGPLVARGRTWVRSVDGAQPIPQTMTEITRREVRFLQGKTSTTAPRAVEHSCLWGIYHGQLDYFRGKCLDVTTRKQAEELKTAPAFPFDLAPRLEDGRLRVQALWQGKPQGKGTVHVWPPGGREKKVQADEQGIITIAKPVKGTYSFSTLLRFPDEKGQFDGQPYQGVMHGVTLTMPWPLD